MRFDINLGIFDLLILLGIAQGLFISWFFIKNRKRDNWANLYQGLLILTLSLAILEEFLNNTGYIVKVIQILNFAEPFNFIFAPLLFLYVRRSLNHNNSSKDWIHLIPFIIWFLYSIIYFIQPNELKYNSYLDAKHPEWEYLEVITLIHDNPLGLRNYINELTITCHIAYLLASIHLLVRKLKILNQSLLKIRDSKLIVIRNTIFHFLIITLFFIFVKIYFGRDIGDYFLATYISFVIFFTSYQILNRSSFFDENSSFLNLQLSKYKKSTLTDEKKERILTQIKFEIEDNLYYRNNLASLSDLAKRINETKHNVSQVINEKMDVNFFQLLAKYRIGYAIKLLEDPNNNITIEELAEVVGYNSKSSFNNAFKKITKETPSEFRQKHHKT